MTSVEDVGGFDAVGQAFDAIVLAGGSAHRLGGAAKPQLKVAGASLLDHVLAAVQDAERIVVVGPRQPVSADVRWCREEPAGAGPVAALAAGLPHTAADALLVLGADLPWIAPAVPALLSAVPSDGVALLVDPSGHSNYLAAAWRRATLSRALADVGGTADVPMRTLLAGVEQVYVPDQDGWGRDVDTWDDLARARSERKDD